MGWFEIKPTDSKRLTGWPLTRTHPRTIPEPQAPAKPVKCGNPTQLGRRDVAATQGELCFASMFNSGCFTNRDFHVLNFRSVVQDRTIWYSWAPLELKTPITWYYVWGSFFDRKLNLNKCLGRAERMLDFSKAWLTSQFLENPENWDVFKTWYYNVIDLYQQVSTGGSTGDRRISEPSKFLSEFENYKRVTWVHLVHDLQKWRRSDFAPMQI